MGCSAPTPRRSPARSGLGPSLWSCPSRRPRGSACSRAPGSTRVAIRAPSHETARALIEAAGVPLAAPSANRSGRVSPTTAAHVAADLDGRVDFILDAGPCRHGLESTIVACLGPRPQLLRPGAITREAIESALRAPVECGERGAKRPERAGATGVTLCAEGRASALRGQRRGGRSRARFRWRARGRRRARPARSFAVRRPRRGGGAPLFLSSHARRRGASTHCGRTDPCPWAWGGDQRSAAPGGRAQGR